MKLRIRHTPDNYWVVERKVLWWWTQEQGFFCSTYEPHDSAKNAALEYAQRLINPTIIEVTK